MDGRPGSTSDDGFGRPNRPESPFPSCRLRITTPLRPAGCTYSLAVGVRVASDAGFSMGRWIESRRTNRSHTGSNTLPKRLDDIDLRILGALRGQRLAEASDEMRRHVESHKDRTRART